MPKYDFEEGADQEEMYFCNDGKSWNPPHSIPGLGPAVSCVG